MLLVNDSYHQACEVLHQRRDLNIQSPQQLDYSQVYKEELAEERSTELSLGVVSQSVNCLVSF